MIGDISLALCVIITWETLVKSTTRGRAAGTGTVHAHSSTSGAAYVTTEINRPARVAYLGNDLLVERLGSLMLVQRIDEYL